MMITEIEPSGNWVGAPVVLIMLAKGRVGSHGTIGSMLGLG